MKVIKVRNCANCPYVIPDAYKKKHYCTVAEVSLAIPNINKIPKYCPLPDIKEKVTK